MNCQSTYALFLIAFCLSANISFGQINFQAGNLERLQARASMEDKLLFVHFTASWCMPCQWMEKNTFQDEKLARFLKLRYLPVRIDIDTPAGYRQKEKYRISLLPTILIIDGRGLVIGRFEESMPPDRLYQFLKQSYEQKTGTAPATVVLEAPPRPKQLISRPALVPEIPVARPSVSAHTEYASLPTAPAEAEAPPSAVVKKNYGIQVAVFENYDNAIQHMDELKRRFRQPVNIFVSQQTGKQKLYRILIGVFDTTGSAGDYARRLQKENIYGIVKDLSTL